MSFSFLIRDIILCSRFKSCPSFFKGPMNRIIVIAPKQQIINIIVGNGSDILPTIGDMKDDRLAKQRLTSKLMASNFGLTVLDSYIK